MEHAMTLFDEPNGPGAPGDRAPIPDRLSFKALREAVQDCHACELWEDATQAVMGAGPRPGKARLMLVGEQPGDREDIEGKPFVGPAGHVLDDGLERGATPT
jgi:DNA polymerase